MATPKSLYYKEGDVIDYVPSAAKIAGDIVTEATMVGQVTTDLAASEEGGLRIKGVIDVQKTEAAISKGGIVGWDNDGSSVSGVAGEGAAATYDDGTTTDLTVGVALAAAGSNVATVRVLLGAVAAIAP